MENIVSLGKPKVFKFEWDGKVYEVNYPKMKDLFDLPQEDMTPRESIQYSISFLTNLGMPKEVLEEMDYDVVIQIQEKITAHATDKKK